MKNVLCEIERAAARYPEKTAVADDRTQLSYQELLLRARKTGSAIGALLKDRRRPVAVYMDKTPDCVAAMLGTVYSGNFYVVLDSFMPADRISRIFETLQPAAVLTDQTHWEQAGQLQFQGQLIQYEETLKSPVSEEFLRSVREEMTERDPLYVLYTSGSTGRPKGTVVSHRAVLAYTRWAIDTFGFDGETIFGSQAPFYFSMSVTDLYSTLQTGATLQIIPKQLFSFPMPLVEYLNRWKVNTIYWVPSALCIVANWDTFAYAKPEFLRKILFAGEVMPNKQLNYWRKHFPDALFADLFGPTETTDICTFYVVDRPFADEESLPIGRPCDNCRAMILDENGREADTGELYIGGPFLADGYYHDPEKTAAAFVRNPLNDAWPETVYRTGDLVSRRENGELVYLGRRDNQIKHMGYRIELGEIEANAGAADGVAACVCVYDGESDRLILLYQGKAKEDSLLETLRSKVPAYMVPNKIVKLKSMPYNANGKIDRAYLKKHIQEI